MKERKCMGICGSHGHHISYFGKNLTAYFCRPRCSLNIDSAIESTEAHIEGFMSDLEDLWASEFGGDWGYSGDNGHEGGDGDWWPFGNDNDVDDDGWPFGGDDSGDDDRWPFVGGDSGDDDRWPFLWRRQLWWWSLAF